MDEGFFVPSTPTFGIMELEAGMSSPDDLLFYLSDPGQGNLTQGLAFDSATHILFDDFTSTGALPSSSPSASSPASSPPSSFSFSSSSSPSPSDGSPLSSPSSVSSCISPDASSPEGPRIDLEDHFVFGSWMESALNDAGSTISPSQLQPFTPQLLASTPVVAADEESPDAAIKTKQTDAASTKKDTRKRKRAKKNGDETPLTAVTLPREELLKLSSQELEEYAENLRKVRKLTAEEEKDLRRQRRLIKNRESAQLSRVRRREHMEELEQQLQEVQVENARLKQQVAALTAENLQLKQQMASPVASPPPRSPAQQQQTAVSSTFEDEESPSLIKMVQGWTTLGKGATATAVKATYLFVILLSIGLFFNARFVHYGPGLGPLEMSHVARGMPAIQNLIPPSSAAAELASSSASVSSVAASLDRGGSLGHAPQRHHRDILQFDEDSDNLEKMEVVAPTKKNEPGLAATMAEAIVKPGTGESFYFYEKVGDAKSWRKETPSSPFLSAHSATTMPAMTTGESANKTILMCPTVTPLQWPGELMSANTEEITFLLPASSAAYVPSSLLRSDLPSSSSPSSFSATARQPGGSMVQLTCKIVDARTASLGSLLVQ